MAIVIPIAGDIVPNFYGMSRRAAALVATSLEVDNLVMHSEFSRWWALLVSASILGSLAGLAAGCRMQRSEQSADTQKSGQPAAATAEGRPAGSQHGEQSADKREVRPKQAYDFPLQIKIEAPEVPDSIRRPSPPIPKKADEQRPKK